ncbi:MAG: Fis family transcriptional regulator [Myxococcota bacterium]
MKNKHIGSSLSSFLDEEGIKEEVDLRAKKKVLADQMRAKMRRDGVTVAELARRMSTSRTVVIRLLDPSNVSFTFKTLAKASQAFGLDVLVSLAAKERPKRGSRARARAA